MPRRDSDPLSLPGFDAPRSGVRETAAPPRPRTARSPGLRGRRPAPLPPAPLPDELTTEALLALLFAGPGLESLAAASAAARALAVAFPSNTHGISLRRIAATPLRELAALPGVGPTLAARLQAALDVARRLDAETRPDRDRIIRPQGIYDRFRFRLRDRGQEEVYAVLLDAQNSVIDEVLVSRGTIDTALIHPRDVYRHAIAVSAASVVLVHNHPSGDPTPSEEDRAVTESLRTAGELIGIELLDHVIVGEGRYVSFAESSLL